MQKTDEQSKDCRLQFLKLKVAEMEIKECIFKENSNRKCSFVIKQSMREI